ncbi:MAG: SDR family oxidoreductase [Phycisphaerae bacterium]|nr:SDR family oxidoreductase [Phycisphaerae bacterium]
MARDLSGKVIVITGASAGIGAATAIECARAGMDVVLNARRAERLEAVAADVRSLGRTAEVVPGDITERGFENRLLDAARQRFGGFYAVLANAGYAINRPIHEMSEQELRQIFEVNFFAATWLLAEAARRLITAGRRGHLLMTSSAVAKFTFPNTGAYSATKAAQNHVCRQMRLELRPYGIAVSSIHPITTRTEFFDVAAQNSGRQPPVKNGFEHSPRFLVQSPEVVARAVVHCLRHPVPEVWTSRLVQTVAGVVTAAPGLADQLASRRNRGQ